MPKEKDDAKKKLKEVINGLEVDENQLRRQLGEKMRNNQAAELSTEGDSNDHKHVDGIRIGGIEGGSTHSSLIIMDGAGTQLTHIEGPGTNHWALGMKETAARINTMIERAKETLKIPKNYPLDCVGLCLSGCEAEESNKQLRDTLLNDFPNASRDYVVGSDTMGSLKTGSDSGGIVLIAGTGSNALLINSDGSTKGCGGWGHMMGDEGGAFWITRTACKYVFDDMDCLEKSPYPTSYIWPAMRTFFHVTNRNEMLPHLYTNFQKSKMAMFTKELADGCEKNDPLCQLLFTQAGQYLAKYINALSGNAHNDIKLALGGLKIICVGSVWKSWKFMKDGFTNEIEKSKLIDELVLLRLKTSSAIGACYIAANKIKCHTLVKTHDKNSEEFFHYKRSQQ